MNNEELKSVAEKKALEALSLNIFRGFDLVNTKNVLAQMLAHIGRDGMFSEYTKHDISHVNGMLALLDDIIVERASDAMTPSDWLMIVLSVYFHDLGMIITNEEFEHREDDDDFMDYYRDLNKKSYEALKPENRDKAIYQDYVRRHHGDRVCDWICSIEDTPSSDNPICKLLYDTLHPICGKFRHDLAMVCKSHQESLQMFGDDSADVRYSQDKESRVNLIFCAAVLRTADLLHVNSERTPDVDFLLISPKNEYSRREWVKQKAVTCIQPKLERDKDGVVDKNKEKHLFEVIAEFTDDEAYSNFNKYLDDAQMELQETNRICRESSKRNGDDYSFPWDGIDRNRILTKNFSADKLSFELDKENILKLLIGHTLYSDANVVLRELAQNAIDAGRLMDSEEKESSKFEPKVQIEWNSKDRILKVADNGVGMSEDVIRNYLFKVGVSNYRSNDFKKEYPNFHSISHFGIGILTCFMVSDDIYITTRHYKEKVVHLIKIRNVEGEYILRHDAQLSDILECKHGTTFVLKLRDDATVGDFEKNLRNWIFIPRCKVSLDIDGKLTEIGYANIDEAMRESLAKLAINVNDSFEIAKYDKEGMSLRILMKKNEYVGNSFFYTDSDLLKETFAPIGCCVEGVRVVDDTPGYYGRCMIALVDCVGPKAPSTNVARDRLEEGDSGHGLSDLYRFVYDSYIKEAIKQAKTNRYTISIFAGVKKAAFIIDSLQSEQRSRDIADVNIFDEMLGKNPCVYLDNGETCSVTSVSNLPESLCTVDSQIYASASSLATELANSSMSPQKIIGSVKGTGERGKRTVLIDQSFKNHIADVFLRNYQVEKIEIDESEKSVFLHWRRGVDKWYCIKADSSSLYFPVDRFFIQKRNAEIELQSNDKNIYVTGIGYFIMNTTPVAQYIEEILISKTKYSIRLASVLVGLVLRCIRNNGFDENDFERFFSKENYYSSDILDQVNKDEFRKVLLDTKFLKIDFGVLY